MKGFGEQKGQSKLIAGHAAERGLLALARGQVGRACHAGFRRFTLVVALVDLDLAFVHEAMAHVALRGARGEVVT